MEELRAILELVRLHGVSRLSIGDISLELSGNTAHTTSPAPSAESILHEMEAASKKSLKEDKRSVLEDELSELILTNPLEFEKIIRKGEISHDDEEDFR